MAPGACSLELKIVFRIVTRLWTMFLPGRAPSWLGSMILFNTFFIIYLLYYYILLFLLLLFVIILAIIL